MGTAWNPTRHRKGTAEYRMGAGQVPKDSLIHRPDPARMVAAPARHPDGSLQFTLGFHFFNFLRASPDYVRYVTINAV